MALPRVVRRLSGFLAGPWSTTLTTLRYVVPPGRIKSYEDCAAGSAQPPLHVAVEKAPRPGRWPGRSGGAARRLSPPRSRLTSFSFSSSATQRKPKSTRLSSSPEDVEALPPEASELEVEAADAADTARTPRAARAVAKVDRADAARSAATAALSTPVILPRSLYLEGGGGDGFGI